MTKRSNRTFEQTKAALKQFIDLTVIPLESWHDIQEDSLRETVSFLKKEARKHGFSSPQMAIEDGGMGLNWEQSGELIEVAGRSYLGPLALDCAPPGQPDIFVLNKIANEAQKNQYLKPLIQNQISSCFAMTEPAPGAGSDPAMLLTTAQKTETGWVLNGHKWFITGARQADVAFVVAKTEKGVSWFLVETNNPGFKLVRDLATLEPFDMGGHGEILLDNCELPDSALLGEEGNGLEYAQWRLEGARLFHCMRFIGLASRAMECAQDYVSTRYSQGRLLKEHQLVQGLIADAHIHLYAARMMTKDIAQRLDRGESIRHHSSMAKVFVAEAVYQIADNAVQLCGALGVSEELPLSSILRMLRPFRIYDGASEVHRAAIARRALHKGFAP